MDYYFRYLVQYSHFYNEILPNGSKIYIDGSYLYNFQSACYNLVSRRNLHYFIDPETFKFQYGGDRVFYVKYLEYFEEFEGLFNDEKIINLEFLEEPDNFTDFYKKVLRYQRTMLANTQIPLNYYRAIAGEKGNVKKYNPIENLDFFVAPYFEFYQINDDYYDYTLRFSLLNSENYSLLRFPKELLLDPKNIEKITQDFQKSHGILINALELSQYSKKDLNLYFKNLIDLIYRFSLNNQEVILMNNSEFGKYLKYFGLKEVCSNVMIGQTSSEYKPFKSESKGGSSNFIYIPQIERSISITKGATLIARNAGVQNELPRNVETSDLNSRINSYYEIVQNKVEKVNQFPIEDILEDIENMFNQVTFDLHRREYRYINLWKDILLSKYNEYFEK
ncbi:MAG: hypothetical protein GF383_11290 [Candidatus Lokiarchaeota archaeon]|nr:hypothetical protein [Candidatus Lokiarchaeota archaeon]MBD3341298.1 hypothetical protein [Candidatus Lokiarchaeota archaeon]